MYEYMYVCVRGGGREGKVLCVWCDMRGKCYPVLQELNYMGDVMLDDLKVGKHTAVHSITRTQRITGREYLFQIK